MSSATLTLTAPGMTCGHCAGKVTEAVRSVAGVRTVSVDIPTRQVTVDYDPPADATEVLLAITRAGYDLLPARPDRPGTVIYDRP